MLARGVVNVAAQRAANLVDIAGAVGHGDSLISRGVVNLAAQRADNLVDLARAAGDLLGHGAINLVHGTVSLGQQ